MNRLYALVKDWWEREHWYAEFWSAIVLLLYFFWALEDVPDPQYEWPPDLGFTHVMPDWAWQSIMLVVALGQLVSLVCDSRLLRGLFAFLAGWLASWITLNIYIYGYGFHPGLALCVGWVGVNMFAVSRAIAGLK